MEPNVFLPFLSSTLSFVFALFLLDQWLERRRSYQLIWMIGMVWYGISAGTEFWGGAFGWSEPLYRIWYLIGAVYVAAWLGLGTMYLLGKTRFGYGAAISVLLAGLFTLPLAGQGTSTPTPACSRYVAFGSRSSAPSRSSIETYRAPGAGPGSPATLIIGGSIVAVPLVLARAARRPRATRSTPTGSRSATLMPGSVRLLTPLFNITGGVRAGVGRALQHVRVHAQEAPDPLRPEPLARASAGSSSTSLIAPIAITVNLVASIPGTLPPCSPGKLNSRVPATILLAIGGFIPSLTSGLSRFGITETFYLGELLGVVFLFAGHPGLGRGLPRVPDPVHAPRVPRPERGSVGPAPAVLSGDSPGFSAPAAVR